MALRARAGGYSKRLYRAHYEVLAALLLADGEYVSADELSARLWDRPMVRTVAQHRLAALMEHGLPVEADWHQRRDTRGYRLRTLPADEHLQETLWAADRVRESGWYRWWMARGRFASAASRRRLTG